MSEQGATHAFTVQLPGTNNPDDWIVYWKAQGQPWRTEPEIDKERQAYLSKRRSITPDIEKGVYPFKDIEPVLTRADVEWLLATHENGRGPVDWSDESQRHRKGLDLRGAILNGVNLSGLPLACLVGGLTAEDRFATTSETFSTDQRTLAAVHLEGANLFEIHLEGADLSRGHLERANVRRAYLERAKFHHAHLEGAFLSKAHLEGAILRLAHLEGTILYMAHLEDVDLRNAFFNNVTNLEGAILGNHARGFASLADVSWNGVNLAVVDWAKVKMLGEEFRAYERQTKHGEAKSRKERLSEYEMAVRANRQLAVALQAQGLNEEAARFAYRAQKLQCSVLRRQRKFGQYLFYLFLDLLAGYGYRPGRSVLLYLFVVFGFTTAYYAFGHLPLLPDALVFSLTSFHGRGFFPGLGNEASLHNSLVVLAAMEAVVGLFIEISFIATFTRRFFGS